MKLRLAAAVLPALLVGSNAGAAPAQNFERPMETAQGAPAATGRATSYVSPRSATPAWNDFQIRHGAWTALWDADTAVPLRLWGQGIASPGANADAATAEAAARKLLAQHIALLAPGAHDSDFELVANVVHGASGQFRTVAFAQRYKGVRVHNGAVNFLFENDRAFVIGSTAMPSINASVPAADAVADVATAKAAAHDWISKIYGGNPQVVAADEMEILPIVTVAADGTRTLTYHTVVPVTVDLAAPRGRWTVYTDARTGAVVAREQKLLFNSGTMKFHVPIRWPGDAHEDAAAASENLTAGGSSTMTDLNGLFSWSTAGSATVVPALVGPYVKIINQAGALATGSFTVANGGAAVWDQSTSSSNDGQLTAFIRENEVKNFVRTHLNPNLAWLDQQFQVNVNVSGSCNAFYDGSAINFYPADSQCENTARLADVIRHETGHAVHDNSYIQGTGQMNGSLSEGVADYLAATMSGDHLMGIGFFFNGTTPVRDLAPATPKVYPQDMDGEPHDEGEIFGESMWATRQGMIAALGATQGQTTADNIYYGIVQRAADIPSSYTEALAADDDDGDLSNGTPHKCIIDAAFAPHGLVPGGTTGGGGASIAPPSLSGMTLTLTPSGGTGVCPGVAVSSATVTWRLRATPTTTGTVNFATSGANLTAQLPTQPAGTVVQYQVAVHFADNSTQTFPVNAADPWYETYVGPVTPIYCTDFESNPASAGWTMAGDFQWGAPTGATNDPAHAYSGTNEIGDDLGLNGGDGQYAANSTSTLTSPNIAINGNFTSVRLQYRRWLTVEDSLYDHATISADGTQKWINLQTSGGTTQHQDREWRFQDVDITDAAADGHVQIAFGLTSDPGLQFGGWNIDDFCVVGVGAASGPVCGNGIVEQGEQCDDGNTTNGDGCSSTCQIEVTSPDAGPGAPDAAPQTNPDADVGGNPDANGNPDTGGTTSGGCCSTGGAGAGGSLALGLLTLVSLRRRRK